MFTLCKNMVDLISKVPLLNEHAWTRADNALLEILDGYYYDPPEVPMYTKKVDRNESVLRNKYGMNIIGCMHVTNQTDVVHKSLVSTFGGCNMQVEMYSYVHAEQRHHYNHKCLERRRLGFPIFGKHDTWLIDKLQNLKNLKTNISRIT